MNPNVPPSGELPPTAPPAPVRVSDLGKIGETSTEQTASAGKEAPSVPKMPLSPEQNPQIIGVAAEEALKESPESAEDTLKKMDTGEFPPEKDIAKAAAEHERETADVSQKDAEGGNTAQGAQAEVSAEEDQAPVSVPVLTQNAPESALPDTTPLSMASPEPSTEGNPPLTPPAPSNDGAEMVGGGSSDTTSLPDSTPATPDGAGTTANVGGTGNPDALSPAPTPSGPEPLSNAAESALPPIEPDTSAEPSAESPHAPEPAPAPGAEANKQPTPDQFLTEQQIQDAVAKKIADLPAQVQELMKTDTALKDEYNTHYKKLVSEELQKTIDELNKGKDGKANLADRIDRARGTEGPKMKDGKEVKDDKGNVILEPKSPQIELAHVLEERQGRIREIQEQAQMQATLELLGQHPELQRLLQVDNADSAKVADTLKNALSSKSTEAEARRVLASEELKAEKGRAGNLDHLAALVDELNAEKPNEARIRKEQLGILKDLTQQEALGVLVDDYNSPEADKKEAARKQLQQLLEFAHDPNHPLSKNALLRGADSLNDLAEKVIQQGKYLNAKRDIYAGLKLGLAEFIDRIKKGKDEVELLGIAKKADDAKAHKFADAQSSFEAKLNREMAKRELTAKRNAGIITQDEYNQQMGMWKQLDHAAAEDEENAEKQMKQKFRAYARGLKHSWGEWRKATKPEEKAKAWEELKLSAKAVAKEGAISALKWLLIWQAVMLLTMIAVEMRMAGKMFGQDGK